MSVLPSGRHLAFRLSVLPPSQKDGFGFGIQISDVQPIKILPGKVLGRQTHPFHLDRQNRCEYSMITLTLQSRRHTEQLQPLKVNGGRSRESRWFEIPYPKREFLRVMATGLQ
jgi:hypothetical protein